jgi:F-type H+-transporting ATPase subunit delta
MVESVEFATVLDSTQQRAGEIYARALLGIGESVGQVEPLLEQLDSFVDDVLAKLPQLRLAMESPRISLENKERLIDRALGDGASREFRNFLKVVARKRRFDALPAIRAAAHKLYNDRRGRVAATLTTAEPISDDVRDQTARDLARRLGKEIQLRTRVDPEILGGIVIRIGDTVYDGSLKNQLRRVRTVAIQRAYDQIRQSIDQFMTP